MVLSYDTLLLNIVIASIGIEWRVGQGRKYFVVVASTMLLFFEIEKKKRYLTCRERDTIQSLYPSFFSDSAFSHYDLKPPPNRKGNPLSATLIVFVIPVSIMGMSHC
jgi:hypothetical protein